MASSETNRTLEKKRQEGGSGGRGGGGGGRRAGLERRTDLTAAKCTGGSGRGEEVQQKRLTEESSLAIANSIHTIVRE